MQPGRGAATPAAEGTDSGSHQRPRVAPHTAGYAMSDGTPKPGIHHAEGSLRPRIRWPPVGGFRVVADMSGGAGTFAWTGEGRRPVASPGNEVDRMNRRPSSDSAATWRALRALRSNPPGAGGLPMRKPTFAAAMEQSEQLFAAAEAVGPEVDGTSEIAQAYLYGIDPQIWRDVNDPNSAVASYLSTGYPTTSGVQFPPR